MGNCLNSGGAYEIIPNGDINDIWAAAMLSGSSPNAYY